MDQNKFREYLSNYTKMSEMLKAYTYDEILTAASALANISKEQLLYHPMGGYSKGMTSGAYQYTLQDLLKNIEHYDWLYSRLGDETSKVVFSNLIGYRLFPAVSFLKAAYDAKSPQYFDKEIVSCNENEVFVDCGGFTGDTTEEFIRQFGQYKRIYVYEPSPENIQICQKNLEKYPNITIRPCGTGEKAEILTIQSSGSSSTFMTGTSDSQGIRIVSLDDDIRETITFLKMDIEGSEISALLGAKRHIQADFPKLAICTYHIVSDMWEIARLIDAIHPGYQFYFRHYDYPQNWETILYAIPPEKAKVAVKKQTRKTVIAISSDEGWTNAQLMKDCGVIPYIFHKNFHCDVTMVGGRRENEDYSNQKYISGVKLKFLPDSSLQAKANFIYQEAPNIDCMEIYGFYPNNFVLVDIYKKRNPQGKILLLMDANMGWTDREQFTVPSFQKFMEQCDVVSVCGRALQEHLNRKWPWIIERIACGFYCLTGQEWDTSFERKKNIILTVSRLGIPQKATNILLEAFAAIAEQIPEWELRLEGDVAPEFNPWMEEFWKRHPELKGQIHFIGRLTERADLYTEYLNAKIFALPSVWEGWPNVLTEALAAGNAIAVTKIDGYEEMIDYGRCGMYSDINDINGFSNILLQLCQNPELEKMCCHAQKYAKERYDMEQIAAKAWYLLFGNGG